MSLPVFLLLYETKFPFAVRNEGNDMTSQVFAQNVNEMQVSCKAHSTFRK